ncbi:hypothetical protein GCM10028820_03320 [Tessaracoccus terricola]
MVGAVSTASAAGPTVPSATIYIPDERPTPGTVTPNAQLGWSWGGPAVFFNKTETRQARSASGWVALCATLPRPVAIFCGLQVAAITKAANAAYDSGKCLMVYTTPLGGVPTVYTGKECF